jgi:hypothetical protein
MTPLHRDRLAAIVLALTAPAALHAQTVDATLGVFAARERLLAHFDGLPEPHLKTVFLRCAEESSQRALGLEEAVPCAMAWDALLRRSFAGDVEALLGWWRTHRRTP